jgi:hypothetical protein
VSKLELLKAHLHLKFLAVILGLLIDVRERVEDECSDEGTNIQNIHDSFIRSYASEEENRTRNHKKNESVSGPLYVY